MPVMCELWMSDPDREVGKYEFDSVPRTGEVVSLPKSDEDKFVHFNVG